MSRRLKLTFVFVVAGWSLSAGDGAEAASPFDLYWSEGNGISRATGTPNSPKVHRLIVKGIKPDDVAVTGNRIFWVEGTRRGRSRIGTARLNGSHVRRNLVTGLRGVEAIDANDRFIYWISRDRSGQRYRSLLGRAKANGSSVRRSLRRFSYAKSANGPTVSKDSVFWSELRRRGGTTWNYFMKADLRGNKPRAIAKVPQEGILFATSPPGPVYSFSHLYWVQTTLGLYPAAGYVEEPAMFRARLGTRRNSYEPGFGNIHFKQNRSNPAADSEFIYWKQRRGWISRMNLETKKRVMRYIRTGDRGYDIEVPLTG